MKKFQKKYQKNFEKKTLKKKSYLLKNTLLCKLFASWFLENKIFETYYFYLIIDIKIFEHKLRAIKYDVRFWKYYYLKKFQS